MLFNMLIWHLTDVGQTEFIKMFLKILNLSLFPNKC